MPRTPLILAAALLGVLLACAADRPACYAGDYRGCTCAEGSHGYQACSADGEGYGACVCDGTTPGLDAAAPAIDAALDAALDAAGRKGFLASCSVAADCESGLCQTYPSKGSFCTKPCTPATATSDCPAPSTGCNMMGVCKVP